MPAPNQVQLSFLRFKKNSYINVEGKKDADRFYIIREGQVQISKEAEIIEEDTGNILYPGDFFGVVSCMSQHASIESAKALSDVTVVSVYRDQFGLLIQKHSPIAMKIIKSFSHKLRYFDSAITRLSFKGNVEENPKYLYNIGDYYLTKKQLNHSFYAFKKFMQYWVSYENALLFIERGFEPINSNVKAMADSQDKLDYLTRITAERLADPRYKPIGTAWDFWLCGAYYQPFIEELQAIMWKEDYTPEAGAAAINKGYTECIELQ